MVEGDEAVLIWTTSLERGWHQIELVAEVEKDFALCFTVGTDDGFNEDTTIRLSDWSGTGRTAGVPLLPASTCPSATAPIDPSSGNFVLQRFVMAPVLTWQVAVKGLNKLLKKMVTAPLQTWEDIT